MQTKRDLKPFLGVLPAAISACLIPMPAQACVDVVAGFAVVGSLVAVPTVAFSLFGLRKRSVFERLILALGGFLITALLTFLFWGTMSDLIGQGKLHSHMIEALFIAAPTVLSILWVYAMAHPESPRVAKAIGYAKKGAAAFGCLLVLAFVGLAAVAYL
jgi:hypothetical protein